VRRFTDFSDMQGWRFRILEGRRARFIEMRRRLRGRIYEHDYAQVNGLLWRMMGCMSICR
jgi:hypothetical protein